MASASPATYFSPPKPGSARSIAGAVITAIRPATRNHDAVTSTSLPAIDPTLKVPGGRRGALRGARSSLMGRGYPNGVHAIGPPARGVPSVVGGLALIRT